ncbi:MULTISPECIES: rod shape-determining protein MreD [Jeotgalicoccus]|uniref:rod shape-determining protein MreD n=1 Tax=Jeotgalicoccus TaxID=227979 RepID=UPI0003FEBFD2|nr:MULTISPECIES: rod shape-determining protein MreD [Jeotgalicoccus]QQD85579.1 rod shape-determining protein MreD [Jeotgalicoccus sp. ATCC 8456]
MQMIVIFILGIILMYIDMTFTAFSPMMLFGVEVYFVPKFLFMYILLLTIYAGPKVSMFFALLFGVMLDVYIGSIYGIYSFGFIAFVIFMQTAFRVFYRDFVAMAFVVLLNSFFFDLYQYLIYRILEFISMPFFDYIALRAIPSVLVNAIMFTIIYVLAIQTAKVRKELRSNN